MAVTYIKGCLHHINGIIHRTANSARPTLALLITFFEDAHFINGDKKQLGHALSLADDRLITIREDLGALPSKD